MITSPSRLIRARWILPVQAPPIENGWVETSPQGDILALGRWPPTSENRTVAARVSAVEDLGDVAILPALVNAHTHLDLSDFAHPVGEPGIGLADWIGQVARHRFGAESRAVPRIIEAALTESRRLGVGLIGDIATPPDAVAPHDPSTPAVVAHCEVIGLSAARYEERYAAAQTMLDTLDDILDQRVVDAGSVGGLSPHAPYSLAWESIRRVVEAANRRDVGIQMHVAESAAERELLFESSRAGIDGGPFERALRKMNVWQDGLFPWRCDDYRDLIQLLAGARYACLIHGNDLNADEMAAIAEHHHVSVVYCPRTHAFFEHPSHPIDRMLATGIRVALGTDSRASNPDLNLWAEMKWVWNRRQEIAPEATLRCGTIHGAEAMGRQRFGKIALGARPGLVSVATTAVRVDQLWQDFASVDHPVFLPTWSPSDA